MRRGPGFSPVTAEATVFVKPRPVTLIAASDSKVYDGLPLTTNGFAVATDTTTPEKAAADAKKQIELFEEKVPDAKIGTVEFVDIVLERTYDKAVVEETAKGNYNKDSWKPADR